MLVGHSYGGMVIAGVAAAARRAWPQLVYLDAFLPEDGTALTDYAPLPPARADGWRIPPPGPPSAFGIPEQDLAWVGARLGDQPSKTFTQPVRLANDGSQALPQTYIQCTDAPWFAEAAARAKRRGLGVEDLRAAGHDAMVTQPIELTTLLLHLVEQRRMPGTATAS